MQTENTIDTRTVERVAKLALVRVVDFEALAADNPDGSITLEQLQAAGDFVIVITPNGRDAKQMRHATANEATGRAWLAGFEACAALKKKGKRKPAGPHARMSKPELLAACKKKKIDTTGAKTKADLVALLDAAA